MSGVRAVSAAHGVNSNEEAGALMAAPHVGCSNNSPLRVIPDVGKVTEDPVEPEREMTPDVLQDDEAGSQVSNGSVNSRPEVSGVIGALSAACG